MRPITAPHTTAVPADAAAPAHAKAPADAAAQADSSAQAPGSTRDAALALLLRHGHATAATLAKSLGVSVQVMRRHLRALEDEGLVASSTTSGGPGRPTNHWQLTARGQDQFPDGSEAFAVGLLQSMVQTLPAETLRQLLAQQGSEQARIYRSQVGEGCLQERLERLVDLRRREGYVAECSPHPDGESWVIQEFHCSVMRIAEQFPCVCDQELRLIRETFPDCRVDRVQWRLEAGHSCGFRLQPRQPG